MTQNSVTDQTLKSGSLYIRIPAGYGDNLMGTAVVEAIAKEYPQLRIFICTKREDVFENNPHISALYDTRYIMKHNMSIYNRCCILEYPQYAQLKEATTIKHYTDYFYDCIPLPIRTRIYKPCIYLSWKEKNYNHRKLQTLTRPLVTISPYGGATTKIPNKFYPIDKWPAVVQGLLKQGLTVIQLGSKKEGPAFPGVVDFRNIGYRKSAAVLMHSDLLITHPSGFMHLATALDVPCMTLFSGTEDPLVGGYPSNPNLTVDLDCAPCWLPKPCNNPKCKEILSPEKVVFSAVKFVNTSTIKSMP
jgi:ADP-heptose:LPS heptosyltransferase